MIDFSGVKNAIHKLSTKAPDGGTALGTPDFYQDLIKKGEELIRIAFATSDFNQNRTQNLADSYGSCLFVNGKEYPNSRKFLTPEQHASKPRRWYGESLEGRTEIGKFFDNYQGVAGKTELVIAVAMPYGIILEEGSGRLKRKYRVISGLSSEMDNLLQQVIKLGFRGAMIRDING